MNYINRNENKNDRPSYGMGISAKNNQQPFSNFSNLSSIHTQSANRYGNTNNMYEFARNKDTNANFDIPAIFTPTKNQHQSGNNSKNDSSGIDLIKRIN